MSRYMKKILRSMASSLFVIGGCTQRKENGGLSSIEKIDFSKEVGGRIKLKSIITGQMNSPRRSASTFSVNNDLIVVGGCSSEGVHLNSMEILRQSEDGTMKSHGLQPTQVLPHSCAAFCSINKQMGIILGGYDGVDCLKSVHLVDFSPDLPKFIRLKDMPTRLKNSSAVVLDEQNVLVFGGWDESSTMRTVFRVHSDDSWNSYDMSMEAMLPYSVEGHSSIRSGDDIFIVGGYDGISVLPTIIRYSIPTKRSQIMECRLSEARENHVCEIVDGHLLVIGGWNGAASLKSIEIFEISPALPFLHTVHNDSSLLEVRNRPSCVSH